MQQRGGVLRLIGAFRLVKALILVAAGIGLITASDGSSWVEHLSPSNRYVDALIARLASADPHKLKELGAGSFVYAALFTTEGIGLWLRTLWAEYLTLTITTSFIPLEVYEMVQHGSVLKGIVIALNIAIVIYLVWRLRRDKHWPFG